jgi:hypothetical protein
MVDCRHSHCAGQGDAGAGPGTAAVNAHERLSASPAAHAVAAVAVLRSSWGKTIVASLDDVVVVHSTSPTRPRRARAGCLATLLRPLTTFLRLLSTSLRPLTTLLRPLYFQTMLICPMLPTHLTTLMSTPPPTLLHPDTCSPSEVTMNKSSTAKGASSCQTVGQAHRLCCQLFLCDEIMPYDRARSGKIRFARAWLLLPCIRRSVRRKH